MQDCDSPSSRRVLGAPWRLGAGSGQHGEAACHVLGRTGAASVSLCAHNKEFLAAVGCLGSSSDHLPEFVPRSWVAPAPAALFASSLWWNTMECFH